jgi:AraC family transcriptional regulator
MASPIHSFQGDDCLQETLKIRSFIGTHNNNWEDPQLFSHESLEITNVLEGSGYCRFGNKEYAITAGQIIVIPAGFPHSFHALTSIRFGVLLIDCLTGETREMFNRLLDGKAPGMISLSRVDQEQYELLFRQWLRIAYSPLKEPHKNYQAWLQVLILFIQEHSSGIQQALSISHIADSIRQNLQTGIVISELAKLANLSENGLRKQFFNEYGMTPKHYQQMCRFSEAKWLLNASAKDIQSIATALGFAHLHSFSSWFKDVEGQSPTEWRKMQRLYHN